MARHTRWCLIFAIVILGLIGICAPAQAQQFSATKNVSNNSDYSYTPQVAVDSKGTIYLAWEDDTATNSNILFSRSTDGGATFSTPINLSNASDYSFNPRIAISAAGSVDVVWEYETADNTDIMFSHSTDAGLTFTPPINLSNDPADSENEQIATDTAGNIYVVWENDSLNLGVLFSHSSDGGATFSTPAVLSTNTSGSYSAQIAIGTNGNLSVVWEDDGQSVSDVSFSHSSDHGATFSSPQSLSYHTGNSGSQQIAIDLNGNIDVVWTNETSGKFDIFFTRSVDNGATFSTPSDVSNGSGNAQNPQMGLDAKGNINLVWEDNMPSDIYFARSNNGGGSFSSPVNISNNGGFSVDPFLTVDGGGNVSVAWEDDTPGNKDIFFSRSTDSGATFSEPINLSNDPLLSLAADMAADKNGNINVTWQDSTPGVSQVFFSRLSGGTVANQPPVANAGLNQTIACSGPNGSSLTLDGSQSSDPDGDALTFVWTDETGTIVGTTATVQVTVGLGTHVFTLTVTDAAGLSSTASTHVTVGDTTAPTLQVSLSPNLLWPPNHTLIPITATVQASDSCDANPAVTLVSITSNEPDDGLGDGDKPNDIQSIGGGPIPFGTDVSSFLLRAERAGMGLGRLYTVTYTAKDASGNVASASAQVIVPIDGPTTTTTADPPRPHADPPSRHRNKKRKKHDDRDHDRH
ncbi:MAG TPA: PKD domain-containing protein [Candidatus Acidoferrales bacterium]|nr:PKD domain-containing protein [Candidatus Acidoferrales bacterium]